ncbi:MAG: DNA polymerase IV [Elusimicrobiota bacterium]
MLTPTIFLLDMDSYFASVEQSVNPALRGKPVAVCGAPAQNDGTWKRTIIVTASYEARKYGIKTGTPVYEAKKLCPHLNLIAGNHEKYIDTSVGIQKILTDYTDQVEVYSIDECFMDVTDTAKLHTGGAVGMAKQIKQRIREKYGITCSIGIGSNKVTAKLAAKFYKPDGLYELNDRDIPQLFDVLPLSKLQGVGIGRQLEKKLNSLGINTAKQLGDTDESLLTHHFGILGHILKRIGQGRGDTVVRKYNTQTNIKSVGHSLTLPSDTCDLNIVNSYLLMLSEKIAARLRKYGFFGRVVSLYIRYGDFTGFGQQHNTGGYINTGHEIYGTAQKIFVKLLPLKKSVRLAGLSISSLVKNNQTFLLEDINKTQRLVSAIDGINNKYGEFTLRPAMVALAEKFGKQENRCGLIGKHIFDSRRGK